MALTPRAVIGTYNDGTTIGLRCALPGANALTGSSDAGDFSFDSTWTDIVKTHQVGLGAFASLDTQESIFFPSLGYPPHYEVRRYNTSLVRVYDDYFVSTTYGADTFIFTNTEIRINNPGGPAGNFMYIIYKVAAAAG